MYLCKEDAQIMTTDYLQQELFMSFFVFFIMNFNAFLSVCSIIAHVIEILRYKITTPCAFQKLTEHFKLTFEILFFHMVVFEG